MNVLDIIFFNATSLPTYGEYTTLFNRCMDWEISKISDPAKREFARSIEPCSHFVSEEAYLTALKVVREGVQKIEDDLRAEEAHDDQIFWSQHRHLAHLEGEELRLALEEESRLEEEERKREEAEEAEAQLQAQLQREAEREDAEWLELERLEANLMGLRLR